MIELPTEAEPVKVVCGDALELLRELPDGCVQLLWTDPPYGHGNMQDDLQAARVRDAVKGARVRKAQPIVNDRDEDYRPLLTDFLSLLPRVLDPDCCCCCCCCAGGGGPSPAFGWLALQIDIPLKFFHAVVWDKSARGDGMGWRYRRNYEFVMVAHRKGGRLRWSGDHPAIPNLMRDVPVRDRNHPNEKPVSLVRKFIRAHTDPGDLILDPFGGSGTTAVAALHEGRRCLIVEKDPTYCDIIRRRVAEAQAEGPQSLFATSNNQPDLFGDETG